MSDSGNYFLKAKLLRKFKLFGLKFLLDIRYILWTIFIIKLYIGCYIKIMAKKKQMLIELKMRIKYKVNLTDNKLRINFKNFSKRG